MAKTAQQLMEKLHANPEWVAAHHARQLERQARCATLQAEARPLLDELGAVCTVISLSSILSWPVDLYITVLPVLLRHFGLPYSASIRAAIAQCFHRKEALSYFPTLVSLYKSEPVDHVRQVLANSINHLSTKSHLQLLLDLALNAANGESRLLFLVNISKRRGPEAKRMLERALSDPYLAKEAAHMLARKH